MSNNGEEQETKSETVRGQAGSGRGVTQLPVTSQVASVTRTARSRIEQYQADHSRASRPSREHQPHLVAASLALKLFPSGAREETMESSALVAAQVSSLFPSTQAISLVVETARTDAPLPPASISEQATYSELFHTEATGSILLRVIHDSQVLELISLCTDTPPLRIVFPAPVLPNPSVMWNPGHELHVLAVTSIGSLFRITVPIADGAPLWHAGSLPYISSREFVISKAKTDLERAIVHVQGLYSVAVAYSDGFLLRLEAGQLGHGEGEGTANFLLRFFFDMCSP